LVKLIAFAFASLLWCTQVMADDQNGSKPIASLKTTLYRVAGDISGDTSLTDDIFEGLARPDQQAKSPYTFFTLAKLSVAGVKLGADTRGWKWDGQEEPPVGHRVQRVAKPTIKSRIPEESVWMKVDSADPIQYFHKREDGLFELRVSSENVGLTISSAIEQGVSERLVLRDFTISTSFVEKRKPIEAVSLDVGEPILSRATDNATVALKPGVNYGILLTSQNTGLLLIRMQIEIKVSTAASR
jgi:hypothetical protein